MVNTAIANKSYILEIRDSRGVWYHSKVYFFTTFPSATHIIPHNTWVCPPSFFAVISNPPIIIASRVHSRLLQCVLSKCSIRFSKLYAILWRFLWISISKWKIYHQYYIAVLFSYRFCALWRSLSHSLDSSSLLLPCYRSRWPIVI